MCSATGCSSLAMNTVGQNACQSANCSCCSDGGATNISAIMNGVGTWGAVIASVATGHPIQTNPKTGQVVGVKTTPTAAQQTQQMQFNQQTLLIIAAVVVLLVLLLRR